MSLPGGCQLAGFLGKWQRNWTEGFIQNVVIKNDRYITLNIALK